MRLDTTNNNELFFVQKIGIYNLFVDGGKSCLLRFLFFGETFNWGLQLGDSGSEFFGAVLGVDEGKVEEVEGVQQESDVGEHNRHLVYSLKKGGLHVDEKKDGVAFGDLLMHYHHQIYFI